MGLCTPTIVFALITTILTLCVLILDYNFSRFLSTMFVMIIISLIITGICNIDDNLSWFITLICIVIFLGHSIKTIVFKNKEN
jgi:hypothetical protein